MKRFLFIFAAASLLGLLVLCPAFTQERSISVNLRQLRVELLNSKLPLKEVNSVAQTLGGLLGQGSTVGELRSITLNIAKKGISGSDLNACLGSVKELVELGVKTNEAADIVLDGIDQGLAYGFKGGDTGLLDKVQEAVKEKKQELLDQAKREAEEKANEQAGRASEQLTGGAGK
jgi:hypothetical protein